MIDITLMPFIAILMLYAYYAIIIAIIDRFAFHYAAAILIIFAILRHFLMLLITLSDWAYWCWAFFHFVADIAVSWY